MMVRRSITSYSSTNPSPGPSQAVKRPATTLAAPSVLIVEERLRDMGLFETRSDDDNYSEIKYAALPASTGTEEEEEPAESHESFSQETEIQENCECTSENIASTSSEYEGDLEDGSSTLETSANDSLRSEGVHKPLKDLIFKANKEFYDVDSNRVKIKVGLSKNVPSLHPRRNINGASLVE